MSSPLSKKKAPLPYPRRLNREQRAHVRLLARMGYGPNPIASFYGCDHKVTRKAIINDYRNKDNVESDDEYITQETIDEAIDYLGSPNPTLSPPTLPPTQPLTLFKQFARDPDYHAPRIRTRSTVTNVLSSHSTPSQSESRSPFHPNPRSHPIPEQQPANNKNSLNNFLQTLPVDLSDHYTTLSAGGLSSIPDLVALRSYNQKELVKFFVQHFPAIPPIHAFHLVKGLHRLDSAPS